MILRTINVNRSSRAMLAAYTSVHLVHVFCVSAMVLCIFFGGPIYVYVVARKLLYDLLPEFIAAVQSAGRFRIQQL